MKNRIVLVVAFVLLGSASALGQLIGQSELDPSDADPNFKLTLDHISQNARWMGVSPREITWSPDGRWLYFRWRQDPKSDQLPATDPWYVVDRNGTHVSPVPADEVWKIPAGVSWSRDRKLAAWTRSGTLLIWTRSGGLRPVFSKSGGIGNLSIAADGSRVFFSTSGLGRQSRDHGDLWAYYVQAGHVRQIARGIKADDKKKKRSKGAQWIYEEEQNLIEIVRKRKGDREKGEALARERNPFHPMEIPAEDGSRIFNLQLTPDGSRITFQWIKDPGRKHRTQFMEFVAQEGYATKKDARPKVGEPLPRYKLGYVTFDPTLSEEEIEIHWLDDETEKETVIHGPYWNAQGTHGLVQILSMDHKDRWISLVDLDAGRTRVIDHQHEEAWIGGPLVIGRWAPGYLEWLPEGDAFGFFSTATGWSMLHLGHVDGRVQRLTSGEWEVRQASLAADGRTWHLTTSKEHPGEQQLYHLPSRGGILTRITAGEGKNRVFVSPDGGRIATRFETPRLLADLYLQDNTAGASRTRITKTGSDDFYRYSWIDSEIISFPDPEGEETWAKIWESPQNPNGAAVVYAHGCGECAQAVDKGWSRVGATLYANFMHQMGYNTASVDYRGSSGYGHRNRTYAYRQMGISDIDSALPLLDILVDRYGVARNRIGVYGGSYGGFFTIMSLLRHPGKYAAGVALYPVTDWAHYNQGYTSRILNGTPSDDPEAYRRSSPVYYADGLQDALQIQHGLVDNNVQIQDSFRLAQILMEKKKNFDLVVYPMEDHGWDEVPSRRDSYHRMTEWFQRFLLAGPKERDEIPSDGR